MKNILLRKINFYGRNILKIRDVCALIFYFSKNKIFTIIVDILYNSIKNDYFLKIII